MLGLIDQQQRLAPGRLIGEQVVMQQIKQLFDARLRAITELELVTDGSQQLPLCEREVDHQNRGR